MTKGKCSISFGIVSFDRSNKRLDLSKILSNHMLCNRFGLMKLCSFQEIHQCFHLLLNVRLIVVSSCSFYFLLFYRSVFFFSLVDHQISENYRINWITIYIISSYIFPTMIISLFTFYRSFLPRFLRLPNLFRPQQCGGKSIGFQWTGHIAHNSP